ncbi:MAG: ferrous iron transport protein B, partial [Syntrophomonadaceae bacterium]|nr:ferrous iron transport protein B [Syntrophomonadaceae bacterium]
MSQLDNRVSFIIDPARIAPVDPVDRLLIGRYTRIPVMLALLLAIFWLTISGANYPSQALSELLFSLETPLLELLRWLGLPAIICEVLVQGVYRVLAWVVSVVLPPMAIFFPLFSLLEKSGGLHRIAFNLDGCYRNCGAGGQQALTACMGFGCNAVGVIGARMISAPRERLMAIVTNSFSLCNGRWPALIVLLSVFGISGIGGSGAALMTAALLCGVILLGGAMSLLISKILSVTILPGIPQQMPAELPPLCRPRLDVDWLGSVAKNVLAVLG